MELGLRSHHCGELRATDVGSTVVLMGWVSTRRDHGGVIFVDLRDHTGLVQVVFKPDIEATAHREADALRGEFVIAVQGEVAHREQGNVNPKLDTGEVEVLTTRLEILNKSRPAVFDWDGEVEERLRMTYRYFDLRRPEMQRNLRLRAQAAHLVRNFLTERNFLEVETPVLTRATPEGARDYIVPSRVQPGSFYALPQSPQLFKQLLMVGGCDRYYQIVKCFRDEDLRGNRQPEFTQIDMELAFTTPEEVYGIVDELLAALFGETIGVAVPQPIPRMTYDHAMSHYGTDAPDLRYDLRLVDITDLVAASSFKVFAGAVEAGGIVNSIRVPGGSQFSRKDLDDMTELVGVYGARGMAWVKIQPDGWQSPIAKFFTQQEQADIESRLELEVGDLAVFCADRPSVVHDALGNLRRDLGQRLGLDNSGAYEFVWVTDFPLLAYDELAQRHHAVHHPFTAPVMDDLQDHADDNPGAIRSQAYDIVLNGVELGGGSMRIHRQDIQDRVFELLGISREERKEQFGFLLEALNHGAPPHGGIALGFDRIAMFLVGTSSIRDVIAFPKTQRATDLMVQAPATVTDLQLRELGIRLRSE